MPIPSKPHNEEPEAGSGSSLAVRSVTVEEDYHGQRIDNFLLRELKGVPRSRIYRLLRKGEVRVNKGRIKPEFKLSRGDVVRIPPVRQADNADQPAAAPSQGLSELLESAVLYEDEALLVVNKPSGLAVHGGSGIRLGLIEALRQIRPQARFLELVHRLDRDTSGCVMVAKKRSMLKELHQQLRDGLVDKRYLALVEGKWPSRKLQVNSSLQKNTLQSGERMVRVDPDGKASLTHFKVLKHFAEATLVEAKPVTGRTHQIRVHCQAAGHPILGDEKYCADDINRRFREAGLKRLFLHAHRLTLKLSSGDISIEAPLASDLEKVLERINK